MITQITGQASQNKRRITKTLNDERILQYTMQKTYDFKKFSLYARWQIKLHLSPPSS